jgi:myosin-18
MTADLAEEHSTSTLATERLDAETSERIRLERELSEIQHKNKELQQSSERLEMELLYARSDLNGISEEDEDGDVDGGVYKQRYERAIRELEFTKRRLQQQHEDDLEQLVGLKKQLEKKVGCATSKQPIRRLTGDGFCLFTADGRLRRSGRTEASGGPVEEESAEAERRDERFEVAAGGAERQEQLAGEEAEEVRFGDAVAAGGAEEGEAGEGEVVEGEGDDGCGEVRRREQPGGKQKSVMRESGRPLGTTRCTLQDTRLELELKEEKLNSLQRDLEEITCGGKTEEEVTQLRRQKIDCERRLQDQEEELDELAGQVQLLEQAKLRLEMSLESMRKESKKETQMRDDEVEEVRCNAQKKVKALEAQLENEHEERTLLLREKHELERRLAAAAEAERNDRAGDEALLQRLKRDLKRTKVSVGWW